MFLVRGEKTLEGGVGGSTEPKREQQKAVRGGRYVF